MASKRYGFDSIQKVWGVAEQILSAEKYYNSWFTSIEHDGEWASTFEILIFNMFLEGTLL